MTYNICCKVGILLITDQQDYNDLVTTSCILITINWK